MDSGNSGSMQSSSGGGDEEYESRGESFTSFLNPSGGQFGSISDHPHPPPQPSFLSHQYQNTLFNPNTQNLEAAFAHSSSANTQYGNDIVWSRGLTSQTNHHHNFENLIALSSSPSFSSSNQSLFGTSQMPQFASSSSSSSSSSMPSQSIEANNPPRRSDHPSIAKNPKKRTRASRRAPTTVLPTDTTNFRQMVQQFTGIPTAPFSSSSSPYSRRQDLFSGGSGMRSGNLDALNLNPFYPLRPSAQKLQMSPFLAQSSSSSSNLSSTVIEALMSSTNTMNQSTTNNVASTTPQNLLSMQNQILSFNQHALPTSLKNSSPILGTNSPTANTDVTPRNLGSTIQQGGVTVSSFDDFGLRHENVNIQQLGSNISGNYKLNCSGSRSEFHSDKGVENVSSSGEGTVGPWISPSDH